MADFDMVMKLEDLPSRSKPILTDLLGQHPKARNAKEAASEFIGQFNEDFAIHPNTQNLDYLTDFGYQKLNEEFFKEKGWPKRETLNENLKLHETTVLLYKEMANRQAFFRNQSNGSPDLTVRVEAWANYQALFKALTPEAGSVDLYRGELPCRWMWEIVDECIYQYQNLCTFAHKQRKDEAFTKELGEKKDLIPTFKTVETALKDVVQRSGIRQGDGPVTISQTEKTAQLFGYFAYLGLIKLNLGSGYYDVAYSLVQNLSSEVIARYYKRSWGALVTLFYYSGLAYIIKNEHIKGTKILEKCCSFFFRYKHFLSKSTQLDKYSRLVDRGVQLIMSFLSFNKIEIEDNVFRVISERYQDRYQKLLKYDQATFEECFINGCCKIVQPLVTAQDLPKFLASSNYLDLTPALASKMSQPLNKYRVINNVEGVLLIYSKISIQKLSKILGLDATEIENYLRTYDSLRAAGVSQSVFEQTMLKNMLNNLRSHEFEIIDGEVRVKKVEDQKKGTYTLLEQAFKELHQKNQDLKKL